MEALQNLNFNIKRALLGIFGRDYKTCIRTVLYKN